LSVKSGQQTKSAVNMCPLEDTCGCESRLTLSTVNATVPLRMLPPPELHPFTMGSCLFRYANYLAISLIERSTRKFYLVSITKLFGFVGASRVGGPVHAWLAKVSCFTPHKWAEGVTSVRQATCRSYYRRLVLVFGHSLCFGFCYLLRGQSRYFARR
jgi:hypothetical protein